MATFVSMCCNSATLDSSLKVIGKLFERYWRVPGEILKSFLDEIGNMFSLLGFNAFKPDSSFRSTSQSSKAALMVLWTKPSKSFPGVSTHC